VRSIITSMAQLFDLPDELIIDITSHISKSSDMLQLALVSKLSHSRILPLLYENVTFDYRDYPVKLEAEPETPTLDRETFESSRPVPWESMRSDPPDPEPPFTNIMRLARMLESNSLPYGQTVSGLTLILIQENDCNFCQTALLKLLPHLPSLRHLNLTSTSTGPAYRRDFFSFAPLAGALRHVSRTIRGLDIYVSNGRGDGWTIGSLRHFSALEELSIQVEGLLGRSEKEIEDSDLSDLLPPRLKHLQLYWDCLHKLSYVVARYLNTLLTVPHKLETLTIHVDDSDVPRNKRGASPFEFMQADLAKANERAMQRGVKINIEVVVSKSLSFLL